VGEDVAVVLILEKGNGLFCEHFHSSTPSYVAFENSAMYLGWWLSYSR
jgi:hypothetical protein